MRRLVIRITTRILLVAMTLSLGGCVLAPKGTPEERSRMEAAGKVYQQPAEKRVLPEIPPQATWQDVLHRAFLANGGLESAYFDWQAAVARINRAAAWPNSNLSLGYEYMFSPERMKAWDRTTLSVAPDGSLILPLKAAQAGRVALAEAQATGSRFRAAKFDLQRRALQAYLDLALQDERIRIEQDNVNLLQLLSENAAARVRTGAPQQDVLKASTEYELSSNELANLKTERTTLRAALNGLLVRGPADEIDLPPALPAPRPLVGDDATLIAVGVENNPELAALARDVQGRADALELARLAYLPDVNPLVAVTGDVSRSAGAMITLPTTIPQIQASIREARAMLQGARAVLRQTSSDRTAAFVATLYVLRNSERQTALFQTRILPLAERLLANSRQAYSAGSVSLIELIDSQRTLLEVRRTTAEVQIVREKALADLEALAGVDAETTLQPPTTAPARAGREEEIEMPRGN